MRSLEDITDEVKRLISGQLGIPAESINNTDHIANLTVDSIQLFELLIAFENYYQLKTNDDDVVKLNTIDDIIKYVEANTK